MNESANMPPAVDLLSLPVVLKQTICSFLPSYRDALALSATCSQLSTNETVGFLHPGLEIPNRFGWCGMASSESYSILEDGTIRYEEDFSYHFSDGPARSFTVPVFFARSGVPHTTVVRGNWIYNTFGYVRDNTYQLLLKEKENSRPQTIIWESPMMTADETNKPFEITFTPKPNCTYTVQSQSTRNGPNSQDWTLGMKDVHVYSVVYNHNQKMHRGLLKRVVALGWMPPFSFVKVDDTDNATESSNQGIDDDGIEEGSGGERTETTEVKTASQDDSTGSASNNDTEDSSVAYGSTVVSDDASEGDNEPGDAEENLESNEADTTNEFVLPDDTASEDTSAVDDTEEDEDSDDDNSAESNNTSEGSTAAFDDDNDDSEEASAQNDSEAPDEDSSEDTTEYDDWQDEHIVWFAASFLHGNVEYCVETWEELGDEILELARVASCVNQGRLARRILARACQILLEIVATEEDRSKTDFGEELVTRGLRLDDETLKATVELLQQAKHVKFGF